MRANSNHLPTQVEDHGKTGNIGFRRQKEDAVLRVNDNSRGNSASIF